MAEEPEAIGAGPDGWNYFNYFTEVEDHFRQARGSGLFLMSTLDWALVENWKNSGIPLEAVLRGIDAAFDKWRARKTRHRAVNSVAYCTQAVHEEARAMVEGATAKRAQTAAPFTVEELEGFLRTNAEKLRTRGDFSSIADTLDDLANEAEVHYRDLEQLEQRLTALEDKLVAAIRSSVPDEELFQARREFEATMRPYRSRMTTEQIAMLERQYLDRQIQEKAGLPRLSLFYLV